MSELEPRAAFDLRVREHVSPRSMRQARRRLAGGQLDSVVSALECGESTIDALVWTLESVRQVFAHLRLVENLSPKGSELVSECEERLNEMHRAVME